MVTTINGMEHAAKIAESYATIYRAKSDEQAQRDASLSEHFLAECNAALEIASAIRKAGSATTVPASLPSV